MKLSLRTFTQLVEDMAAALQSSASSLVDVSVGSVARALFEANASVILWLQWLILQVLQSTRAATSTAQDLDSWMADFGLSRLPAVSSSGIVTFSRYSSTLTAVIPIGTIVKTADGLLSFSVVEDATIPVWNSASSAYVLPAGVVSADVPVVCNSVGQAGNILLNAISTIASSLPGIDQVSNSLPYSNGIDAEGDQPFRDRFQAYLSGLSRATLSAITSAVANVRQGLNFVVRENMALDGSPQPGSFLVVVDDGSGHPSASLLSLVADAVDAVRPVGTMFSVNGPQLVIVNVEFTAVLGPATMAPQTLLAAIQQSVAAYLNGLAIGRAASATRLAQCAYQVGPSVQNISSILLNGLAADVTPPAMAVIKAGTVVVNLDGG